MGELPLLEDSVLGALGELAAATGNHQTGREMLVRAQMMLEDAGQALERARVVCGRARVTGAAGWDALASPGRSIGPSVPRRTGHRQGEASSRGGSICRWPVCPFAISEPPASNASTRLCSTIWNGPRRSGAHQM